MIDILKPVFDQEAVTVVFSTGENFAPFCSAAILSLLDHIDPKRCYDIIILDTDMKPETQNIYRYMAHDKTNVSIRIYEVGSILSKYNFGVSNQWTIDCYSRLLIPDILQHYTKAVYLDSDQIIMSDIAELYDIDISDRCLGVFQHVGIAADLNGYDRTPNTYKYFIEKVRIKEINLSGIFMSSTLLINLVVFRKAYSAHDLLTYAQDNQFRLLDMDVLNSLFQDDLKFLSQAWGWYAAKPDEEVGKRFLYAPQELYNDYVAASKNPKIIHFAGRNKPWEDPDRICADEFWKVFRRTPFYAGFIEKQLFDIKLKYKASELMTSPKADIEKLVTLVEAQANETRALKDIVEQLHTLISVQQSWINNIQVSLPYKIARKVKNLFQ